MKSVTSVTYLNIDTLISLRNHNQPDTTTLVWDGFLCITNGSVRETGLITIAIFAGIQKHTPHLKNANKLVYNIYKNKNKIKNVILK